MSYPGYSLDGAYPSAEMQSVYSTAPVDWASTQMHNDTIKAFKVWVESRGVSPNDSMQKKYYIL